MEGLFRIQYCEDLGEYVVADKDFGAEELMFTEKPIYTLAKKCVAERKYDHSCLGCLLVKPSRMRKCPKCRGPVCSLACSQENEHSSLECKFFQAKGILFQTEYYAYLGILRIILSREVFPDRYAKLLTLTSQFADTGKSYTEEIEEDSFAAWKFLTRICKIAVTLEDIIKILSIIEINSYCNIREDDSGDTYCGRLLYEIICKMSHSCSPSVYMRFERVINVDKTVRWDLKLYSKIEIKKGELVSVAYSSHGLDCGTGHRRQEQKEFCFSCLCSRCVDPTEEGTFFSSLVCANSECPAGIMLPLKPLESLICDWQCQKCESLQSAPEVNDKITEFKNFVRDQISQPVTEDSLQRLDKFITKNSGKTLHKNHWLIFMSSEFWLNENDFASQLIEKSKNSKKLFKKIMERASRNLSLARKFLAAGNIASMEVFIATTMGVHLFKTRDIIKLDTSEMNLQKKLRYSRSILGHCLASSKWLQINGVQNSIDGYCQIWQKKCNMLTGELKKQDDLQEEEAFTQIATLFEKVATFSNSCDH